MRGPRVAVLLSGTESSRYAGRGPATYTKMLRDQRRGTQVVIFDEASVGSLLDEIDCGRVDTLLLGSNSLTFESNRIQMQTDEALRCVALLLASGGGLLIMPQYCGPDETLDIPFLPAELRGSFWRRPQSLEAHSRESSSTPCDCPAVDSWMDFKPVFSDRWSRLGSDNCPGFGWSAYVDGRAIVEVYEPPLDLDGMAGRGVVAAAVKNALWARGTLIHPAVPTRERVLLDASWSDVGGGYAVQPRPDEWDMLLATECHRVILPRDVEESKALLEEAVLRPRLERFGGVVSLLEGGVFVGVQGPPRYLLKVAAADAWLRRNKVVAERGRVLEARALAVLAHVIELAVTQPQSIPTGVTRQAVLALIEDGFEARVGSPNADANQLPSLAVLVVEDLLRKRADPARRAVIDESLSGSDNLQRLHYFTWLALTRQPGYEKQGSERLSAQTVAHLLEDRRGLCFDWHISRLLEGFDADFASGLSVTLVLAEETVKDDTATFEEVALAHALLITFWSHSFAFVLDTPRLNAMTNVGDAPLLLDMERRLLTVQQAAKNHEKVIQHQAVAAASAETKRLRQVRVATGVIVALVLSLAVGNKDEIRDITNNLDAKVTIAVPLIALILWLAPRVRRLLIPAKS